jgi:hypothetical protein
MMLRLNLKLKAEKRVIWFLLIPEYIPYPEIRKFIYPLLHSKLDWLKQSFKVSPLPLETSFFGASIGEIESQKFKTFLTPLLVIFALIFARV